MIDFLPPAGNLSLSRAIGDFNFKSNKDLPQEDQIITGMVLIPPTSSPVP